MCYTTKTNCSDEELCYVGIGKAGKCVFFFFKSSVFGCVGGFYLFSS